MGNVVLTATELSLALMWAMALGQKLLKPQQFALELGRLGLSIAALPAIGGVVAAWEAVIGTLSLLGNPVALPLSAASLLGYSLFVGAEPCSCLPGPRWINRWPRQRNLAVAILVTAVFWLTAHPSWAIGLIRSLAVVGAAATALIVGITRVHRALRRPSTAIDLRPNPRDLKVAVKR